MKKLSFPMIGCMLALIVVLSACAQAGGGAGGTAGTDGGAAAPAAPAAGNDAAAGAEAGEGTIGNYHFTKWVWGQFGGPSRQRISDFSENLAYMEKERITGVTIEWLHPPLGQEAEQFSLMMAALDLPDILQGANHYRGGFQAGINDGVFIRLNELIEEHAPYYYSLINFNADIRREAFTDQGYIQGFGMINSEHFGDDWTPARENYWAGPFIRGDWLEELGLSVPETIDEWTTALKAIRDTFDPEIVLSIQEDGFYGRHTAAHGAFVTAFGIGPYWYQVDGTVKWGPAQPEFRGFLELFHYWYSEGLIDPEFSARHADDVVAAAMRGELGARQHSGTAFPLQLEPEGVLMVGAPYPRLNAASGPVQFVSRNNWITGDAWTAITSVNAHPEAAVRWMDWNYSYEGLQLLNFGPRGVTFDEFNELGAPIYFEEWAPPNWDLNNDVFRIHNGPYLKSDLRANPRRTMMHLERFRQMWNEQMQASSHWNLPPITLTAEEGAESATIMADANAFRDEMVIRFIIGDVPLSEFDNYLATMESFNVQRAADIREAALQRFLER